MFVTQGGKSPPVDLPLGDFDFKANLLEGEIEALSKTDSFVWNDSKLSKHTSCWYNFTPKQYVGNYRNWVFSQQVKDGSISSYKANYDSLSHLSEKNFLVNVTDGLSDSREAVYNGISWTWESRGVFG